MPVEQAFERFESTPLASASMAQVYRAAVRQDDGGAREVVGRPGACRSGPMPG
ncbi:hypothetical protein J4714_13885 [Staphylococcus epidermidis]|nr:hypothetical protein [Staphylococcus epidermidis]